MLLVDGGLPLDLGPLAQLPITELVDAIIGPSLQRLRMTFGSAEEYLDFWRPHPALRDSWNPYIEAYLRYDLVGTEPELRSGVREEAVLADSESDLRDGVVERAVLALRQPAVFLRAPRGLADADPLFSEQTIARWQREVPALVTRTVPDVNHFTITLTENGAKAIAEAWGSCAARADGAAQEVRSRNVPRSRTTRSPTEARNTAPSGVRHTETSRVSPGTTVDVKRADMLPKRVGVRRRTPRAGARGRRSRRCTGRAGSAARDPRTGRTRGRSAAGSDRRSAGRAAPGPAGSGS